MRTRPRFILAAALAASLSTAGCDKKASSSSEESAKLVEKGGKGAAPAAKPITVELFGKKVAPVGLLAPLIFGSSEEEATKAAPLLFATKGYYVAPDVEGLKYSASIDEKTKKLDRIYISIPAAAMPLVAQAWGPGKDAKETIDRPSTYWFDAETGWRAKLEKGFGEDYNLEFMHYLPTAKLLGEDKEKLGFAPDGLLGASLEDLRTRFETQLIETDEATANQQQAEMSKFAGKDLDKAIGQAKPSVRIDLPPTEWGEFWTRVQLSWNDDGKISRFYFKLPYGAHAPAKDELRAMLDKKYGAPKEEKQYGTTGDPIYVYKAKGPRIFIKDDTISKGWDVTYDSKAD